MCWRGVDVRPFGRPYVCTFVRPFVMKSRRIQTARLRSVVDRKCQFTNSQTGCQSPRLLISRWNLWKIYSCSHAKPIILIIDLLRRCSNTSARIRGVDIRSVGTTERVYPVLAPAESQTFRIYVFSLYTSCTMKRCIAKYFRFLIFYRRMCSGQDIAYNHDKIWQPSTWSPVNKRSDAIAGVWLL